MIRVSSCQTVQLVTFKSVVLVVTVLLAPGWNWADERHTPATTTAAEDVLRQLRLRLPESDVGQNSIHGMDRPGLT